MEYRAYSRQLLKRTNLTGVVPTVYTGSDWTTDSAMLTTDLLDGEMFLNTFDQRIWVCMSGSIYELPYSGSVPTFTSLPDVADTYLRKAEYLVRVNAAENAVEFVSGSDVTVATASYTVSSSYANNASTASVATLAMTASATDNATLYNNTYIDGDMYMIGAYNLYFNSGSLYVDNIYGLSPVQINNNLYIDTGIAYLSSSLTLGSSSTSQSGDIRWNGTDFQGYDGSTWISMTGQTSGSYVSTGNFTIFSQSVFDQFAGISIPSFASLPDTPSTYAGNANNILVVNDTADGVEFTDKLNIANLELTGSFHCSESIYSQNLYSENMHVQNQYGTRRNQFIQPKEISTTFLLTGSFQASPTKWSGSACYKVSSSIAENITGFKFQCIKSLNYTFIVPDFITNQTGSIFHYFATNNLSSPPHAIRIFSQSYSILSHDLENIVGSNNVTESIAILPDVGNSLSTEYQFAIIKNNLNNCKSGDIINYSFSIGYIGYEYINYFGNKISFDYK